MEAHIDIRLQDVTDLPMATVQVDILQVEGGTHPYLTVPTTEGDVLSHHDAILLKDDEDRQFPLVHVVVLLVEA